MDNKPLSISSVNESIRFRFPVIITFFSKFVSYIFHPLFIPLYVAYYLVFVNRGYFVGIGDKEKSWILMRIALNMVFFPLLTVLLLKGVGFIESIFLKTPKDRVIPYMGVGLFYFWMYLVFRNQPEFPPVLTSFVFGSFLASSAALIANIFFKISMHAIGCGGMLGVMLVVLNTNPSSPFTVPMMIAIFITGLVCTSRLIVSDHTNGDIYLGLVCGFVCQLLGAAFIL